MLPRANTSHAAACCSAHQQRTAHSPHRTRPHTTSPHARVPHVARRRTSNASAHVFQVPGMPLAAAWVFLGVERNTLLFLADLERSEAGRNCVVLVFSEFGRRVAENGSRGNDHGTAGPLFVAGPAVRGGLYGKHPSLTDLDNGDVKFTTDFRTAYATLIEDWFGVKHQRVLGKHYDRLKLV